MNGFYVTVDDKALNDVTENSGKSTIFKNGENGGEITVTSNNDTIDSETVERAIDNTSAAESKKPDSGDKAGVAEVEIVAANSGDPAVSADGNGGEITVTSNNDTIDSETVERAIDNTSAAESKKPDSGDKAGVAEVEIVAANSGDPAVSADGNGGEITEKIIQLKQFIEDPSDKNLFRKLEDITETDKKTISDIDDAELELLGLIIEENVNDFKAIEKNINDFDAIENTNEEVIKSFKSIEGSIKKKFTKLRVEAIQILMYVLFKEYMNSKRQHKTQGGKKSRRRRKGKGKKGKSMKRRGTRGKKAKK